MAKPILGEALWAVLELWLPPDPPRPAPRASPARRTASSVSQIRARNAEPTQDGGVSERDATLGHYDHEVTGAKLETEVLPHAQNDDSPVEVPALEKVLRPGRFRHAWRTAAHWPVQAFGPESSLRHDALTPF